MKVIIDAGLFEDPSINQLELLEVFSMGFSGRHLVQIAPISDARFDTWLGKQDPIVADECRLAIESGIRVDALAPAVNVIWVTRSNSGNFCSWNHVKLSQAVNFLRMPFRILVEDNKSDRNFILSVATGGHRKVLLEREQNHWISFEHGGGSGLAERAEKYALQTLESLRTWVLFDSDALAPGFPSRQAKKIATVCGEKIRFHQLQRRTIENYLPLLALEHWSKYVPTSVSKLMKRKKKVRAFAKPD